jgi:hypothetical protein
MPSEVRAIRTVQFKRERRSQDRKKPEISMDTLVAWVNHNPKERFTETRLPAVSERIAEITLNVNSTGYFPA